MLSLFTLPLRRICLFFEHVGRFGILIFRTIKALVEVSTYASLIPDAMLRIGIKSIPVVLFIAVFSGMVTAAQSAYQFTAYVPLYTVGSVVGKSVMLELAPVLTALVLAGRIGAAIAAEIGTMKVTEQIDALETLAFNPIAYLVVPRVIAGMIMLPVLTIFACSIGIFGGWLGGVSMTRVTTYDFLKGLKMFFHLKDIYYGLTKSFFFGLAIIFVGCYQGFRAKGGAEGVGAAATNAMVASCLLILLLDYILARLILM